MGGGDAPAGMHRVRTDAEGGTLYAPENSTVSHRPIPRSKRSGSPTPAIDLAAILPGLQAKLTPAKLTELAESTDIPADAWAKLAPGWCDAEDLRKLRAGGAGWADDYPEGAWCLPEYNGGGQLVGLSLRAVDGRKGAPGGSKRGLIVPNDLHDRPDPILVVEGPSDVAACCALGLAAVGRPSNRAGAADLAVMLDGRDVVVVGERDNKSGGAWPGRDGAKAVAEQLAGRWDEPVKWTLPPIGVKDVRKWLAANPDRSGDELREVLKPAIKEVKPKKRTMADAIGDLAIKQYRFGVTDDGEAFAVENEGPAVALMFRGGACALRAKLSKAYRVATGRTPSTTALASALVAMEGHARDEVPEPVALRLAERDEDVVLDLGDKSGHAVVVNAGGWEVVDRSPVLFRRTALTGPLPEPPDDCDPSTLNELRDLLNVSDDTWPLVVGWLVAACIPSIPHPVLMLGGEKGTGKSSAARHMIGLVDPSPAPLRSAPSDPETWAIAAAGSWCVAIDNVSDIPHWWSDSLCKAVTGDGQARRKLWTDSDLAVLAFRRCVILTSIDTGALRDDLGDRVLLVDLEPINEISRRTENELTALYADIRTRLLAGLLSAVARTLAELPGVDLARMPRMADFAQVLAALDRACPELTGERALDLFVGQRDRIARDVVEGDSVATALVEFMGSRDAWSGTAGALFEALTPKGTDGNLRPPKDWPKSARGLSGRLKRLSSALRAVGIVHTPPDPRNKQRIHEMKKRGEQPPQPPRPPEEGDSRPSEPIEAGRSMGGPEKSAGQPPENGDSDQSEHTRSGCLAGGSMGGSAGGQAHHTDQPPTEAQSESAHAESPEPIKGDSGGLGGSPTQTSDRVTVRI